MRSVLALLSLAAVIAVPAVARADRGGAVVRDLGDGARIDWTRGLLLARGAAAGDLRAPSPAVARLAAERRAREAARVRLRELARDLPMADGHKLATGLTGDAARRFDRALDGILDDAIDHGSDGSVVLTCALPLEEARAAIAGAGAPAGGAADAPTALVVEADRQVKRPLLGVTVAAGGEKYTGPTVYAARGGAAAADVARLGARPVTVHATGLQGGVLQVGGEGAAAAVTAARAAGALVVIVIKDDAGKTKKETR